MNLWKTTRRDFLLFFFSIAHFFLTLLLAFTWEAMALPAKIGSAGLVALLIWYNAIVVTHVFMHVPWFTNEHFNRFVSLLNTINTGQSVQADFFLHVRNHHRFNNDQKRSDGTTGDVSSTYRRGTSGNHQAVLPYAIGGSLETLSDRAKDVKRSLRLWKVSDDEELLRTLASRSQGRRAVELRQIQAERAVLLFVTAIYLLISWRWAILCYLPGFFVGLTLVNVQNYYRHYGAHPGDRCRDSVSYYGRLYNILTFNDGYHQEHHLSPGSHWTRLPAVRDRETTRLDSKRRIVSPVPAVIGFLDRKRPLLHKPVVD